MNEDLYPHSTEEFDTVNDPFGLFERWFDEAQKQELNDPNGMALATCDPSGLPNVRMVLLKGIDPQDGDPRGFIFYTNLESSKGKELSSNPQAALLFHWKSLRRQVRSRGVITPVSPSEADEYFSTRHRTSRIGAWASKQSRPLETPHALEKAVAFEAARFGIGDIPRPPHWSGFRLTPLEIEFWSERPFRLHSRLVFRRATDLHPWTKDRLYP